MTRRLLFTREDIVEKNIKIIHTKLSHTLSHSIVQSIKQKYNIAIFVSKYHGFKHISFDNILIHFQDRKN